MEIALRVVQFWSEIKLVITNRTPASRSCDFVITRLISDQIALHSVQLPLLIIACHNWHTSLAYPQAKAIDHKLYLEVTGFIYVLVVSVADREKPVWLNTRLAYEVLTRKMSCIFAHT